MDPLPAIVAFVAILIVACAAIARSNDEEENWFDEFIKRFFI
jgi:hypothetical protein